MCKLLFNASWIKNEMRCTKINLVFDLGSKTSGATQVY